jgi:hypothetical protein
VPCRSLILRIALLRMMIHSIFWHLLTEFQLKVMHPAALWRCSCRTWNEDYTGLLTHGISCHFFSTHLLANHEADRTSVTRSFHGFCLYDDWRRASGRCAQLSFFIALAQGYGGCRVIRRHHYTPGCSDMVGQLRLCQAFVALIL